MLFNYWKLFPKLAMVYGVTRDEAEEFEKMIIADMKRRDSKEFEKFINQFKEKKL